MNDKGELTIEEQYLLVKFMGWQLLPDVIYEQKHDTGWIQDRTKLHLDKGVVYWHSPENWGHGWRCFWREGSGQWDSIRWQPDTRGSHAIDLFRKLPLAFVANLANGRVQAGIAEMSIFVEEDNFCTAVCRLALAYLEA